MDLRSIIPLLNQTRQCTTTVYRIMRALYPAYNGSCEQHRILSEEYQHASNYPLSVANNLKRYSEEHNLLQVFISNGFSAHCFLLLREDSHTYRIESYYKVLEERVIQWDHYHADLLSLLQAKPHERLKLWNQLFSCSERLDGDEPIDIIVGWMG